MGALKQVGAGSKPALNKEHNMTKRKLSYSAFMKRIKDAIKYYDMLHPGDKVLVAVSGGPDSVCLLRALSGMKKLGVEIVVGNLDHGIRKRGSAADSTFVKKLSKELGFECEHKQLDLGTTSGGKISLEEKARLARYKFLLTAAKKHNCGIIATGHTLDDQAETMVMRFMLGASLKGMSGIPPVRYEKGIKIIRPLIRASKKDILQLLNAEGWAYRDDHTNRDTKYVRNSVRHEVLPFLEKYNPRIRRSLANLSDTMREDAAFLDEAKESVFSKNVNAAKGRASINAKDIVLQPRTLRKELFKELFIRAGGDVKKLTYRHWMDMDYFIRAGELGKSLNFPGVTVSKREADIVFTRRKR